MINVYKETWNEIPLLIVENPLYKNDPLPVVTYFHGFTSAKEHNLPLAYLLAEKGYRVILPDSLLHGEREEEISAKERQLRFFEIVLQNLEDLKEIKRFLDKRNLLAEQRIGVAGTSMGGITTAAALVKYNWIKAAAVLMGSPRLTAYAQALIAEAKNIHKDLSLTEKEVEHLLQSLEAIDLSKQMEKLFERPVFFWHGEKDMVVPFSHAYDFYMEASRYYKNPDNIRFLREVQQGHKVSRFAVLETVNWFEYQL